MSGYLDNFGVADARREGILKKIVWSAVILASILGILYLQFRNYKEERQVESFLQLLERKDYTAAYALWGCTDEAPCPAYRYEKFLEDWGPDSPHPDASVIEVANTRSCAEGIFQLLSFGEDQNEDEELWLYVDRAERVISFAPPWPMCHPRMPVSSVKAE